MIQCACQRIDVLFKSEPCGNDIYEGPGAGRPLKVLQVVSRMDRAGAETWLISVMGRLCAGECGRLAVFDFLCISGESGVYEEHIIKLGGRVLHQRLCRRTALPFLGGFWRTLVTGNYDVVHVHANYLGGLLLPIAWVAGVRRRVVHVHSTSLLFDEKPAFPWRIARFAMKELCLLFANQIIACSKHAYHAFFNSPYRRTSQRRVMYCGIDLNPFDGSYPRERGRLRDDLGLPKNVALVVHVGNAVKPKNLGFFVDVAEQVMHRRGDVFFLQVGDGTRGSRLAREVEKRGMSGRFRFLGVRSDVAKILLEADVFVLPSLFEGLPLVLLEAQAAGLRSLASDVISKECEVIRGAIEWKNLEGGPEAWAESVIALLNMPRLNREDCLRRMHASRFNGRNSAKELFKLYTGG